MSFGSLSSFLFFERKMVISISPFVLVLEFCLTKSKVIHLHSCCTIIFLRSRNQRINTQSLLVNNFEVAVSFKIIMGATAGDPNEGGGGAEDGVEDAPSSGTANNGVGSWTRAASDSASS